ncbi:DUF4123 domain-containing protein [Marinobacter sp. ELB17]|uniref:DUF4123 domain-containing protein n=1 Tax=Marinobacter sp. ELB17 TaxID=270374 RepID=UPI0000F399F4|nr:DUF4123 domain-containing protein [Marinobacter sp. ELB17]EAZ98326.1 hypothetical protein MELB17_08039 [Marinobacter sp. ELB17]
MVSSTDARYLVLESRQKKERVLQALYNISDSPRWVYLFAGSEWEAYLDESPILLETAQNSAACRWGLNGLEEESLSGLLLESTQGLDAVVSWLRARLTVCFDGNRKGLLRLYDPKIWHCLAAKSKPEADIIERALYWHGKPGQQRWVMNENPEPIAMLPIPTLNEQQWLALNDASA